MGDPEAPRHILHVGFVSGELGLHCAQPVKTCQAHRLAPVVKNSNAWPMFAMRNFVMVAWGVPPAVLRYCKFVGLLCVGWVFRKESLAFDVVLGSSDLQI